MSRNQTQASLYTIRSGTPYVIPSIITIASTRYASKNAYPFRSQSRMSALDKFRRLANYRIMSQVFKALSDPTRRRVLQLLRKGPMSAGELSDQFDVSKPTMSAHFAVLKGADLVHTEKVGKSVIYSRKDRQFHVTHDALVISVDCDPACRAKRMGVRSSNDSKHALWGKNCLSFPFALPLQVPVLPLPLVPFRPEK